MKHTKWILALLIMALTLTMVSGCSAEQAGETDATEVPGMDVAVDEALPKDEAQTGEATEDDDNPGVQIPFALTLDTTTASLDYSQHVTLTASASIGAGSIQWSCSDESVASISRTTGDSVIVTAINDGTATVTCSLGGASQSCEVTVKSPQTLQITGVDYPATLARGKSWKLQGGTVASTENLTEVSSIIRDANGVELAPTYTETFNGEIKRFDISGIDAHVPFSRIKDEGTYTWTLSAKDVLGRTVSMDLPINSVTEEETEVATETGVFSLDAPDVPATVTDNISPINDWDAQSETTGDVSDEIADVLTVTDSVTDGQNLLVGTDMPASVALNTPSSSSANYSVFDAYHTSGKQTLASLGFKAGDTVTLSFDWSISRNANLDLLYGKFRAEWVGSNEDVGGGYIGVIQNPVATFDAEHTNGRAQITSTLSEAALQAHTIRFRVDNSVLTLTISHAKLERGTVANAVWTSAPGEQSASQNLLDTAVPSVSKQINAPAKEGESNFNTFDPYQIQGLQTLQELGFVVGDTVTISFDWSVGPNADQDIEYGNFRAEWVGRKDGNDGVYLSVIQNPVDILSEGHTSGHAQFSETLNETSLQANTLRIRVDNSVLTFTISNPMLVRGYAKNLGA